MDHNWDSKDKRNDRRRILSHSQSENQEAASPRLASDIRGLQQTIGNRGVMRLLDPAATPSSAIPRGVLQRLPGGMNFGPIEDDSELATGASGNNNQTPAAGQEAGDAASQTSTPMPPTVSPVEKLPTPTVEASDDYESPVNVDTSSWDKDDL